MAVCCLYGDTARGLGSRRVWASVLAIALVYRHAVTAVAKARLHLAL